MAPKQLVGFQAGPFASPFAIQADLFSDIVAAQLPYEGLWIPVPWSKSATVELALQAGTFGSVSADIYATNQQAPLNTYKVTVGGSETDGDVVGLLFTNPLLPLGSKTVSITTSGGQSINSIAAALAAAIAADVDLAGLGFTASSAAAVITIQWPSVPGGLPPFNVSSPPFASTTLLSTALSGGATETLTIAAGTDGTNLTPSHLTALGLTALTPMPVQWVKGRIGTISGSGATLALRFAGAA